MEVNEKKRQISRDLLKVFIDNNYLGTANVATGLGKTFIFLDVCTHLRYEKNLLGEIIFLAETDIREKDLRDDILKYKKLFNIDHSDVKFACYQSACKWINKDFLFVGADEIHFSTTPEYIKFYYNNNYKALLGLTATPYSDIVYNIDNIIIKKNDLLNKICPVIFTYDMNTAVLNEVKSKIEINVIFGNLDKVIKNIEAGNKIKKFYQSEYDAYSYASSLLNKGFVTKNDFLIKLGMSKRSKLLYSLPSKINSVNTLLNTIPNKKTIVFNNDLSSLELITQNVVRSAKSNENKRQRDDLNLKIRTAFDNNKINVIGSFKLLEQGANLVGIERVILMSYYSDAGKLIQRMGRLRNGGEVIIFVTLNTQEEKWFSQMIESIDSEIISTNRYLTLTNYLTTKLTNNEKP